MGKVKEVHEKESLPAYIVNNGDLSWCYSDCCGEWGGEGGGGGGISGLTR